MLAHELIWFLVAIKYKNKEIIITTTTNSYALKIDGG